MSVRKAHNAGRNHERNVLDYYQRTPTIPFTPDCIHSLVHHQTVHGQIQTDSTNRNWTREGTISNRLHHILIRRRRSSKFQPHARTSTGHASSNARSSWFPTSTISFPRRNATTSFQYGRWFTGSTGPRTRSSRGYSSTWLSTMYVLLPPTTFPLLLGSPFFTIRFRLLFLADKTRL